MTKQSIVRVCSTYVIDCFAPLAMTRGKVLANDEKRREDKSEY